MWLESDVARFLKNAFGIRQFRKRALVTFHRFTVLNVADMNANDLQLALGATQPLRVERR